MYRNAGYRKNNENDKSAQKKKKRTKDQGILTNITKIAIVVIYVGPLCSSLSKDFLYLSGIVIFAIFSTIFVVFM